MKPEFHQYINYKDIIFRTEIRKTIKEAELTFFLRHYASFYDNFNTLFI